MATAGRILIIPKGRYNEETQYSMLDMVSYGGKGWICKKTCIGIAPEEGEYWAECLDVSEELNGIDSKIDEVEAMVTEETANRENDIAELNNKVDVATNISKGRNQAHVFNTTAEMEAWIADSANKGQWHVGDNIYIVQTDVPDWWVAEVLEEADAETGYYYKIAQLETQKVDLTTIQDELDTKVTNSFTANRVIYAGADGKLYASSGVTSTELTYLDGVTSNIQTQLNTLTTNLGGTYSSVQSHATSLNDLINRLSKTCKIITDWNAVTENGFYMAQGASNAPNTDWFMGIVIVHNSNYIIQELWQFTGGDSTTLCAKYVRQKCTTWRPWIKEPRLKVSGTTLNITM